MSDYEDHVIDIIKRINLLGINPRKHVQNIVAYCVWVPFVMGAFCMALADLIFNSEPQYMPAIESILIYIHAFVKLTVLVFKTDTILLLATDVQKFWSLNVVRSNDIKLKCIKQCQWTLVFSKIYMSFGATAATIISILPFFTSRLLPMYCYVPEILGLPVIYGFMTLSLYPLLLTVFGFDLMVYTFMNLLVVQLMILNDALENLVFGGDPKQVSRDLHKYIEYHKFLIEFARRLSKMLSLPFLIHFTVAVLTLCLEMYQLKKNPDLAVGLLSVVVIIVVGTQVTILYCHPSEMVVNESSRIILSIYSTDWYKIKNKSLKNTILFTTMRGNKPITISAEGFMDVNMEASVKIFKSILSFYSFLNTIDKKNT